MVRRVLFRIDRLRILALLLALGGIAGPVADVGAQQTARRRRQQGPQKPKPQTPAKPTAQPGPKAAAAAQAAKLDAAGPSQIGTTTIARFACMIDAQTGAVILAKDAEKPMA